MNVKGRKVFRTHLALTIVAIAVWVALTLVLDSGAIAFAGLLLGFNY